MRTFFATIHFIIFTTFFIFLQKLSVFIMFCFRLGNGLEFTKRDKSVDKIRKRQTTNNTVNARINARAPPLFLR